MCFWVIYVVALLFTGIASYRAGDKQIVGLGLVFFVLIGLVGWAIFGAPLK